MPFVTFFFRHHDTWLLLGACLLLTILWLAGSDYPTFADTADYAMLGRSIWQHGTYVLPSGVIAKYMPLYAVVSYPFTELFGVHWGMKVASLLSGWAVLVLTFLIARKLFTRTIAWGTVGALLIHHGFVLMTTFGASDLFFTALTLLSVLFFLEAETRKSRYIPAGIALGLACLTRYNGFPLMGLFFLWVCWKRRHDLRLPSFWSGVIVAALLPALWLLQRMLTMGSLLPTEYITEQQVRSPNVILALLGNFSYYMNPLHNVLPVLLIFGLYGLWRFRRQQMFLMFAMLCLFVFPAFWWSLGIRHAFAGYTIFLMFAVAGIDSIFHRIRYPSFFLYAVTIAVIFTHLPMLCIYSSGACNAWIDRTIGIIPPYMGLTQEGMYAWESGRAYINTHAESGAAVIMSDASEAEALRERFRPDLFVVAGTGSTLCPSYEIVQGKTQIEGSIETGINPATFVKRMDCPAE